MVVLERIVSSTPLPVVKSRVVRLRAVPLVFDAYHSTCRSRAPGGRSQVAQRFPGVVANMPKPPQARPMAVLSGKKSKHDRTT